MSVDITSLQNRQILNTGENRQVASTEKNGGSASGSSGPAPGDDKVSLTSSATRLQALTEQVKALPVVDARQVSDIQRTLATTGLQFQPRQAADNLLEQEKAFALMEMQD